MPKFVIIFLISIAMISPSFFANAKEGLSFVSKEHRVKRCIERMNNAGKWQKKHYAFAVNETGDHCAWNWGHSSPKYAASRALLSCQHRTDEKCHVVYAK